MSSSLDFWKEREIRFGKREMSVGKGEMTRKDGKEGRNESFRYRNIQYSISCVEIEHPVMFTMYIEPTAKIA